VKKREELEKASQSKLLPSVCQRKQEKAEAATGAFRLGEEENHNDSIEAFFGLTGTPLPGYSCRQVTGDSKQQEYTAGSTMWHGHVHLVSYR